MKSRKALKSQLVYEIWYTIDVYKYKKPKFSYLTVPHEITYPPDCFP
jgi:hypothetical protein